jgi:hypothetical protein
VELLALIAIERTLATMESTFAEMQPTLAAMGPMTEFFRDRSL